MLDRAFDPETTPKLFMEELLPALHAPLVDRYAILSEVSVDVGVVVLGESGGTWTLRFAQDGALAVDEGRTVEAPLLSVFVEEEDWLGMRDFLSDFQSELEGWLEVEPAAPVRRLDDGLVKRIRGLSAILHIEVSRLFSDGSGRFRVHMNSWPEERTGEAGNVGIGITVDDLEDLIDGAMDVREAFSERRFRLDGDVGALMPLGGLISALYPSRRS